VIELDLDSASDQQAQRMELRACSHYAVLHLLLQFCISHGLESSLTAHANLDTRVNLSGNSVLRTWREWHQNWEWN